MKTVRDWAHDVLATFAFSRCHAVASATAQAHTALCTEVCEKLVDFGMEVIEKQKTVPPSTQSVGGVMLHLGDLDPAVHSSADGMVTRCGVAMAEREETTLYTVTDRSKVTCAACLERLQ